MLLKRDLNMPSHVLVVGIAGNWQQIIAQIIAGIQDHPEKRSVLSFVVNDSEAKVVNGWQKAKPELGLIVEIVTLKRQPDSMMPSDDIIKCWRETYIPPQLAIVLRDDADAIIMSLALRRRGSALGTEAVPILVRQSKEDRLLAHLGDTQTSNRDMTRMVAFGGLVCTESIERALDRKRDQMAIALHAHYLNAAKTLETGSPNALKAWDALPENVRDANRAAAEHAPILFAAVGFRLVTAGPGIKPAKLSSAEIDYLARVEHRRWIADRIERDWHFGKTRDDLLRLHPALVAYEALGEEDKERDRNAVRSLLSILDGQGLVIVRASVCSGAESSIDICGNS